RVSVRGYWAFQAEHEGDQGLQIGAVGGEAGHAHRARVGAGLLEEAGNFIGVQVRANEVGRVIGSLAVSAVAFVTFVCLEKDLTLCDWGIRSRSWGRGVSRAGGAGKANSLQNVGELLPLGRLPFAPLQRGQDLREAGFGEMDDGVVISAGEAYENALFIERGAMIRGDEVFERGHAFQLGELDVRDGAAGLGLFFGVLFE